MSLFHHFNSTQQFYSYLYSEGFYPGVCSYIIHTDFIIASIFVSIDVNFSIYY